MMTKDPNRKAPVALASGLSCLVIAVALVACSKEPTVDAVAHSRSGGVKGYPPSKGLVPLEEGTQPRASVPLTGTERRVLDEGRKETEEKIKGLVQQFDAHLDDREERAKAEASFKSLLPEYKEKMLALGKEKLRKPDQP